MREEGSGKLWLALAAAAAVVVMVGGVILNASQPQSNETDERTATVGVSAGRRPPREGSLERCVVPNAPQSQEDEEKRVDAFDQMTDFWLKARPQGVTLADVDAFVSAFRQVPRSHRNGCIHRALNLIPDENVMLLTGILMDRSMDLDIVRIVFADIVNRDEHVKRPILRRIRADKDHPCHEDAAWILEATGEE